MRPLILAIAMSAAAADSGWKPPANPDPQAILREAGDDARAGRFEVALAKHVWFHDHALAIQPALYGVRLSFALSAWHDLGRRYPPALLKLREARDRAAGRLAEARGKAAFEAFHDLAAIDRTLREEGRTKEAFEALDRDAPALARDVYSVARPALIRAKAYALAGKYVDPRRDLATLSQGYRHDKELAADPRFGERHMKFAREKLTNDAATLVALLAVNGREAEAEEAARGAAALWDDPAFRAALDEARKGVVPAPWP